MTNERGAGPTDKRRLGAAMLAGGFVMILVGLALLVSDSSEDSTDQRLAAESPEPTATPTATASQQASPTPTATAITTATATPSPTPAPTPPPLTSDDAATFFEQLVTALTTGDTDFLLANLHSDVTDRYGEATCSTYLASVPLETSIQVRDIDGPAPWDWTTNDGFVTTYPVTWDIEIERLTGSQTLVQVMHISEVNSRIVWFTDCGDPGGS